MADMNKLINKFIKDEISLSRTDISESAKSRDWFLDRIKSKIEQRVNEPVLYGPQPFLYFGSYFKGTKVSNVDEYDVLVVIDSYGGQFTQNGQIVGNGVGKNNPNHKYDEKYKKSDGSGVSPAKTLNWLKGIVTEVVESYGGTAPERNGQAITARIESKDINIDLVPAGIFESTLQPGVFFYDIPKGDLNNGWILTNPQQDIKLINELAQKNYNFKNIVRILKYIKKQYNFSVSSFAIECCAISYANANYWYSYSDYENLKGMLSYFAACLKNKNIQDTFDTDNNLLSDVGSSEWYSERVEKIINVLCAQTHETDEEKAYGRVHSILSNC
ncbi:hypothetical protein MSSIT_1391 [Methanosarcina siciliae T4/M]|uniref:Mab-21-like nucleotidyltransferase domain-containing protein n=1 Tax=Methanosarcina siciliae T4/M TaxID=1434120 RepID=A0A0E3P3N4_9EURY|nr:hypothetical protein [Methanosarcina siciliae]AKB28110.1 hypothetical protein MSSIT_1391 [Methanosarcina siciliae T4/M]